VERCARIEKRGAQEKKKPWQGQNVKADKGRNLRGL